jgi:hypothetical protein
MRVRQSQASSDLVAIAVIIIIVKGSTDTVLLQAIVHSHVLREKEERRSPC